MYRPPAPASLTAGRILVLVESVLWLLLGLILGASGIVLIVAARSISMPRFPGLSVTGSTIGGAVLAAGIVTSGLAVAGIWSGIAMGRLSGGARVTALVLASLGMIVALLMLSAGLQPTETITRPGGTVTTLSATPSLVLGAIGLLLNAAVIWSVGFAAATRNAFRSLPSAGPVQAGVHPGWPPPPPSPAPGWAPPLPPGDAATGAVPPPPPPLA